MISQTTAECQTRLGTSGHRLLWDQKHIYTVHLQTQLGPISLPTSLQPATNGQGYVVTALAEAKSPAAVSKSLDKDKPVAPKTPTSGNHVVHVHASAARRQLLSRLTTPRYQHHYQQPLTTHAFSDINHHGQVRQG